MIGPLIGRGNTADVFDLGDDKVIKLFCAGYPMDSVCHEFENSQMIQALDIPIAKSHKLVEWVDRYGIIYDRIDGESMQDILLRTLDLERYSTTLATLHRWMLAQELPSAVSLKSILKRNMEHTDLLNTQCRSELMKVLDLLPDGDAFCHGDFHFGNVIISREKHYVIDYMNVCRGHEYGDIARTVYLIEMTPVPDGTEDIVSMLQMKKQAADIYLQEIGVSRECLSDWLLITAAARLSELNDGQTDEKKLILTYLKARGV